MPPASRGSKAGASAKASGSVLPLSRIGNWVGGGGRGSRRGSGGGQGGACPSGRPSLPAALGVLVMTLPLWLTWRMYQQSANPVPVITNPAVHVGTSQGAFGGRLDATLDATLDGGAVSQAPKQADLEGMRAREEWELDEEQKGGPGSPGYPLGEDDIHVVFSTDCTHYQTWQAIVLFHSAILSGHTGPITQLLSGCSEEDKLDIIARHELSRHTPKHRLHFSEGFVINNPTTGESYPYLNKPNSMQMWLNETEVPETIVALIDPDFLFLKPLSTWLSPTETMVRGDGLSLEGLRLENGGWVRKGHPAGQRFALPNWTHWDRSKFCPNDSDCSMATIATAKRFYDLIPPYLAHREDWENILPEWVDQGPKVYELYPSLLAEQTAYATACATLGLKHYRINNYAVESEKVDYELWDAVDHNMGNVCDISIEDGDGASVNMRSFPRLPYFIHYCHMYRVGQWLFNKRRYRKDHGYDQLVCETPLLELPPMDIQESLFKMHPGARYESITPRTAKRNAFVLCVATRFINSGLRRYKSKVCSESHAASFQTIVRIS